MSKERKRQKARIQRKEVNRKERYKGRRKSYVKRQMQTKRRSGKRKVMKSKRDERIRVRSKEIKQVMSKESRKYPRIELKISEFHVFHSVYCNSVTTI
jgi:hypothetical protein